DGERDLGEPDVAHVRRDRARVAVQRELEPAAEARPVDRRHRRERQSADAREQLVPGADALARVIDAAELVDVGSDAEDERLPREHRRGPVAALQLLEDLDGGCEGGPAQRRRYAEVLAVVDGDEGDRAGAVQLEDRVCHYCSFSHKIAAPMPMPMQSAVSPYLPPRSRRPYASCAPRRTPVAASEWPHAIAPP